MAGPVQAQAAHRKPTRSDLEAAGLFAVVLARLPTPDRCGIDSDWSGEPVPDFVAHSVFKYAIRGGLVPPSIKGVFTQS